MAKWARNQRIFVWGIVVTAVAALVAVIIPVLLSRVATKEPAVIVPKVTAPPAAPSESDTSSERPVSGVVFASSTEELRRQNKVERIHETENDEPLSEIPSGSYGFTKSYLPANLPDKMNLRGNGPAEDFEIHKLPDGSGQVIAYVGSETIDRLRQGLPFAGKLTLYSSPWKEASGVVGIPTSALKCSRDRLIDLRDARGKLLLLVTALDCEPNSTN